MNTLYTYSGYEEQGYEEYGNPCGWWLRSLGSSDTSLCAAYDGEQDITYIEGIAPGFCIGTKPNPNIEKYAVRIYGIGVDQYMDEITGNLKTAGLTFGPATGESYLRNQKGRNLCHQEGKDCISNMTWEEIIAQSKENPNVFQKCMEAGCVVSVTFTLSDELFVTSLTPEMLEGDGASVLYVESAYAQWDLYEKYGDYPASRIRATLNGMDAYTHAYYVEHNMVVAAPDSLYAALPSVLRKNIVPKEVNNYEHETTYDKLWLFSASEIYGTGEFNENSIPKEEEGLKDIIQYPYLKLKNVTLNNTAALIGYGLADVPDRWWLRSVAGGGIALIWDDGTCKNGAPSVPEPLAPGFCLP